MREFRLRQALAALLAIAPSCVAALDSRVVQADGAEYRVVDVDLARDALDLYWLDENGHAYGGIDALRRGGAAAERPLLFATNAGMYDRQSRPLGLTIGGGRALRPLNPARGDGRSGNFALQPNGIFYVDREGRAGVVPTSTWKARGIEARVATQSGPMLVVDGEINAGFVAESQSRKWRNGVCVPEPGKVVFAVSAVPVTFHAFARLFKDTLGCRDALYLDGTLSQIWTAADGYAGAPDVMVKPYAGMLAVFGEAGGRP